MFEKAITRLCFPRSCFDICFASNSNILSTREQWCMLQLRENLAKICNLCMKLSVESYLLIAQRTFFHDMRHCLLKKQNKNNKKQNKKLQRVHTVLAI